MTYTIYENNSVAIQVEIVDRYEAKINCNEKNLIWVSRSDIDDFEKELTALLDKYRI